MVSEALLDIHDLCVDFHTPEGIGRAVDHVDFSVTPGETLGVVGESGCGKSVMAMASLGLIPSPPGHIRSGKIVFDGLNLLDLGPHEMSRIRGKRISMIFQEPMTSLNPVLSIGRQVAEPLLVHRKLPKSEAWKQAGDWLDYVKIPAAKKRLNDYPHQLSGGMRQRVMIAMALICRPQLLIADEPTTALDVTIQSQILSLMVGLKQELNMAVLLITHDLGVIAQMASRVIVMYAGQVVEQAPSATLFDHPFHPYTQGLLKSIPRLENRGQGKKPRLAEIPGMVPPITERIRGCKFAQRCTRAFDICREQRPELLPVGRGHRARCWLKRYPLNRK